MRGTLTIQTDDDFIVHHKGTWMYSSTVSIQIDSVDDLHAVGLIDKHDGSGKSNGVREDIAEVIKNPHFWYDSTGGNRGILWMPNTTKSPTLRDVINKHFPYTGNSDGSICSIEGLDDIAAVDTIIGALIQDRAGLHVKSKING
ncbi:MAG: hypothetical protein WAO78_09550 [Roseovarius sp.]